MAQGTVKWFSNDKGYGFIERTLVQGQHVEFEITEGDKGLQASTVKPVA